VPLLLENTLHHARADTELPADLENPVPASPQLQYSRFNSRLDATPPEFRSFHPSARETGIDPRRTRTFSCINAMSALPY
jgi:hypothetical protein